MKPVNDLIIVISFKDLHLIGVSLLEMELDFTYYLGIVYITPSRDLDHQIPVVT